MKKLIINFLLMLPLCGALAQPFDWTAKLTIPDSTAFYKIPLPPEVLGKLNPQFTDLRIYDGQQKEVPYLLKKDQHKITKNVFHPYEITKVEHSENGSTIIVIHNSKRDKINNLCLRVNNFDTRKFAKLTGSNNQIDWYAIKDDYVFSSVQSSSEPSVIKVINFPHSKYEYYRLEILDWFTDPIHVLSAGYFDTHLKYGNYYQIDASITQVDSIELQQTWVKLQFPFVPNCEKIKVEIEGPSFYNRIARLCKRAKDKKGNVSYIDLIRFSLISNRELMVDVGNIRTEELYIVVENNDNPPLQIKGVTGYQLHNYLVAHLQTGENYHIEFGNDNVKPPVYDIGYFNSKIPENIPQLEMNSVQLTSLIKTEDKHVISTLWIWITIAGVALLVGGMTYKMIREMG